MPQTQTALNTVIVVGHTGLIGSHVTSLLEAHGYGVVGATPSTTPRLDLRSPETIAGFLERTPFQHVVVTAGAARFGALSELSQDDFEVGLESKLMGQVTVARVALRLLPQGGSVTLTSGALSHTPIPGSSAVALVNGAIDAFVRAAALDFPAGRRINAVSPGWIAETRLRLGLDPEGATSAADVARLYLDALRGTEHGRVLSASTDSAPAGTRT